MFIDDVGVFFCLFFKLCSSSACSVSGSWVVQQVVFVILSLFFLTAVITFCIIVRVVVVVFFLLLFVDAKSSMNNMV